MHSSTLADVVIGPHCPLTEWVFGIVQSLSTAQSQRRDVRRIDRFDTVNFLQTPRLMLLANYPSSQIVDAIGRRDLRVVYVVEQPRLVTLHMTEMLRIPVMEAIRSQTASAVANLAIGRSGHTLVVAYDSERGDDAIVRAIAGHLELACPEERIASLAASRPARAERVPPPLTIGPNEHTSAAEPSTTFDVLSNAADEILSPMIAMARGDSVRPVVWPTPVFKFFDRPDELAPRGASIAGPARNLYYGPYLHLPPSRYRVETLLEFSDDIARVPFVLEVHGGAWIAKARIGEREAGGYRGYFDLEHRDATSTVEIRLRNESPVIEGRLTLFEVSFFAVPP